MGRPGKAKAPVSPEIGQQLGEILGGFAHDPYGFVLFAWPWGESGDLLEEYPDVWQEDNLRSIGERIKANPYEAVLDAVAMGNGGGKSSENAWLIWWLMATFPETRGTITAGTESQLLTKLVPEVAKWKGLMIPPLRDMFVMEATSIYHPLFPKTWRCDFTPWNKSRPESVAGLHNRKKRQFILMDEASGIDSKIHDAMEGFLTDAETEIFWLQRGNPTRRDGGFFDSFHGPMAHRWERWHVDTRDCKVSNKRLIQQWLDGCGGDEDHDFFKIHVRGEFPAASVDQFISADVVSGARKRAAIAFPGEPLLMGVDIGRQGDPSIIAYRRGRDARSVPWVRLQIPDLVEVSHRIADEYERNKPELICIDVGGMGYGVYDQLRRWDLPVHAVDYGGKVMREPSPENPMLVGNHRAEIWGEGRTWLQNGAVPDDPEFETDATAPDYHHRPKDGAIMLESKDDMRALGKKSPNKADALFNTFSPRVADISREAGIHRERGKLRADGGGLYNPFADVGLGEG